MTADRTASVTDRLIGQGHKALDMIDSWMADDVKLQAADVTLLKELWKAALAAESTEAEFGDLSLHELRDRLEFQILVLDDLIALEETGDIMALSVEAEKPADIAVPSNEAPQTDYTNLDPAVFETDFDPDFDEESEIDL